MTPDDIWNFLDYELKIVRLDFPDQCRMTDIMRVTMTIQIVELSSDLEFVVYLATPEALEACALPLDLGTMRALLCVRNYDRQCISRELESIVKDIKATTESKVREKLGRWFAPEGEIWDNED